MRLVLAIYLGVISLFSLRADVKSLSGQIKFDTDSNSNPEMVLNTTGLSLGNIGASSNLHVMGNAFVDQLILGESNYSSSNLHVEGTVALSYESLNMDETLSDSSIYLADTNSDNLVLTLPYASNVSGRLITIKKTSLNNTLWVKANGNVIDNYITLEADPTSSEFVTFQVLSDGSKWHLMSAIGFSGNAVLIENLDAWYNFNSVSGNSLTDESGSGNPGVFVSPGGNTLGDDEGIAGRGVSLNGVDEYIQVTAGNGSDFDVSTNDFTISLWFKAESEGRLFHTGTSDHYYGHIGAGGNAIFSWSPGGSDAQVYTVSGNYSDGQWHHFVGLRNGDRTGQFWLDGILEVDDTDNSGTLSGIDIANDFYLGRTVGGTDYLKGSLDELRFYNRALSASEIQLLYFPQ